MVDRGKLIEWPGREPRQEESIELSQDDSAAVAVVEALVSKEAAEKYALALAMVQKGQLFQGVQGILALGQAPEEVRMIAGSKLAEIYIQYGRVHDGLLPFERAHKSSDPQDLWYYQMLAAAYSQMKRYNDAREIYRKALQILGDAADVRIQLAQTYEMEERHYRASKEYEAIRRDYPEDSYVVNQLALTYIRTQRPERARKLYEEALKKGMEDSLEAGIAHLGLRQPEEALQSLGKTLEAYPNDALPYYYTALAHAMKGDGEETEKFLVKALQREPGLWQGDLETFTGWVLTREELSKLVRIWPEEVPVLGRE